MAERIADSPPEPRRRWRSRISAGLVVAIALYVGLRAMILLTSFEDVVMPNFELYPMGTMAQLALRDVHFPVRFYYDNAAGQLVLGQLTIPFFWLFGSSYMVLKCVPAVLGLATLVLLWLLLDRHFSRLAANIGAILFALAPSTLVRYSVVCSGNHFENLFFTTLFLWLFYRHHGVVRSSRSLFLAAFGAGLAIFVFLGAIIPVGLCAAMHLGLRGWKGTLRDLLPAGLGFAIGIAPLVVINVMTSARGLGFLGAKFGGGPARPETITEQWAGWTGNADALCVIGIVATVALRARTIVAVKRPGRLANLLPGACLVLAFACLARAAALRGEPLAVTTWSQISGVAWICAGALLAWAVHSVLARANRLFMSIVGDTLLIVAFAAILVSGWSFRSLVAPGELKHVTTERVATFLGGRLVESGMFEPALGLSRVAWGFVFIAAFAVAFVASVPSVSRAVASLFTGAFRAQGAAGRDDLAFERAKLLPFVLYVPLAALAFGLSDMRIGGYVNNMEAGGYRYYLPTLLFAIVLGAVWTARWWQRGGARRAGAVLLGGAYLASGATSLLIPDWTFREVGNGWRYDGFNYAQMSRGLVSAKNRLSKDEIVYRVSQWPPDVQHRVIRAIGFNVGYRQVERSFPQDGPMKPLEIERVLEGFPREWRMLMASGLGTAVRYQTRMHARTGDLPAMLRHVVPNEGELFDEVVAGSASTSVALIHGWEVRDTFSEDTELMTMDTPSMHAFERGCGHWFARLKQRGVPHEAKMVDDFRAGFQKPTFQEGWDRAEAGLEQ
jgi:hypothetical protein